MTGPQSAGERSPPGRARMRAAIRDFAHEALRKAVGVRRVRSAANAVYTRLPTSAHEMLQRRLAKIFRGRPVDPREPGTWTIRFGGRDVNLPLEPARMWLDWDAALSTLGHDTEVKRTYASLLSRSDGPTMFIDVGANYGTHSLIFLVHGIKTLTFEPNATCHDYFREICKLNGVSPHLERVALEETEGVAELCYPEGETWLGSIDLSTVNHLEHGRVLTRTQVPVRRLDDYLELARGERVLLKVDAEDHEVSILNGCRRLLAEVRPWALFESWAIDTRRRELLRTFRESGHRLARLPLLLGTAPEYLTDERFMAESHADFVAVPA